MIIEKQIDNLTKEQFSFWTRDNILILNSYILLLRESKAKKSYKVIKRYDRLFDRSSTISLEQVPLTEEIRNGALQEYVKTLKVMTWQEYKR